MPSSTSTFTIETLFHKRRHFRNYLGVGHGTFLSIWYLVLMFKALVSFDYLVLKRLSFYEKLLSRRARGTIQTIPTLMERYSLQRRCYQKQNCTMRLLVSNNIFGIVTKLATVISDSNSTMRNTGQTCFGHKTTTNCVRRAVRSFVIMPSLTHVLLRGHTLILQHRLKYECYHDRMHALHE